VQTQRIIGGLSVEEDNPARILYEQLGFKRVTLVGGALTMRLDMR
jgi:ribosomal protein S18 acetylase RimI-like enzyme